ncbi:hypothetical protein V5O48_013824 [Marasmius crinis-equi]|uniref:Transposase n=1 Tax=Marasmius crinis-equi TaxID=585013 RepID=A0ABR3EZ21_9AGAR
MRELLCFQRKDLFNTAGFDQQFSDIPFDDNNEDFEDSDLFALGREGANHSNAGMGNELQDALSSIIFTSNRHGDDRDRHDCTERQNMAWKEQQDRLINAYLHYMSHGCLDADVLAQNEEPWKIPAISFDGDIVYTVYHSPGCKYVNESLLHFGLLGTTPLEPRITFPLHFLKTIRQLHRVCPQLSMYAISRCLTYLHWIAPDFSLEHQLRGVFDTYLSIQRHHVCPPCTYYLINEAFLIRAMLVAMDGNVSLKMVDTEAKAGRARLNTRNLRHPGWLSAAAVDILQDEVANAQRNDKKQPGAQDLAPSSSDNIAWLEVNKVENLQKCINMCIERRKAAVLDSSKSMFSFFAIMDIFLSVCRHVHVLVVCDMRCSRELIKYPLAIVKELLDR